MPLTLPSLNYLQGHQSNFSYFFWAYYLQTGIEIMKGYRIFTSGATVLCVHLIFQRLTRALVLTWLFLYGGETFSYTCFPLLRAKIWYKVLISNSITLFPWFPMCPPLLNGPIFSMQNSKILDK